MSNRNIELAKAIYAGNFVGMKCMLGNIHKGHDVIFRYIAKYGTVDMAKYLINLYSKINIHACCDDAFNSSANLSMLKYLISLESDYGEIKISKNTIYKFLQNNHETVIYLIDIITGRRDVNVTEILGKYFITYIRHIINIGKHDVFQYLLYKEPYLGKGKFNKSTMRLIYSKLNLHLIVRLLFAVNRTDNMYVHLDNELLLKRVCKMGNCVLFQRLIESKYGKFNIHVSKEYIFRCCCCNNFYNMLKYLYSLELTHGEINIHADNDSVLRHSIHSNNTRLFKYLISLEPMRGKFNIYLLDGYIFKQSCRRGNYSLAMFILELSNTRDKKFDINFDNEYLLRRLCRERRIIALKLLITSGCKFNIYVNNGEILKTSIRNNDMQLFVYLLNLDTEGKFDIHYNNEVILKQLCWLNEIAIIQYLFLLEHKYGKFNIHVDNEIIFIVLCRNGSYFILMFLDSLESTHGKININILDNRGFKTACMLNNVYIMNYLIHKDINLLKIYNNRHELFKSYIK